MKNPLTKILLGAVLVAALFLTTAAMSLKFRDYYLNHLQVKPGTTSSMALTNIFEVSTASGTNRSGYTTNTANAGASIVGPRAYETLGGTNYNAVTNGVLWGTNVVGGAATRFQILNGRIVETTPAP